MRVLIISILVMQVQISMAQDKWDLDGKKSIVSLTVPFYNPLFITSENIATKTLFKPGISLEYRYILSPNMEVNIGLNRGKFGEIYRYYFTENSISDSTLVDISNAKNGITLGGRIYDTKNRRGIAPIGRYYYVGVQYNRGKIVAEIDDNLVDSENYNSVNIDLGLGKEFYLKNNLFFSFSAHLRPRLVLIQDSSQNLSRSINLAIEEITKIEGLRNLFVAQYGLSYLF